MMRLKIYTIIGKVGPPTLHKAVDQTLMIIEVRKKGNWTDKIAEREIF
jgi:hypothetical protein